MNNEISKHVRHPAVQNVPMNAQLKYNNLIYVCPHTLRKLFNIIIVWIKRLEAQIRLIFTDVAFQSVVKILEKSKHGNRLEKVYPYIRGSTCLQKSSV